MGYAFFNTNTAINTSDSISSYIVAIDSVSLIRKQGSLRQSVYRLPQIGDSVYSPHLDHQLSSNFTATTSDVSFRHEGSSLPFALEHTDGVFGILLLCFVFFAHIYNGGFLFLKENVKLIFSTKREGWSHRQITTKEAIYSYFLLFQTVACTSICLYDVLMKNDPLSASVRTPLITILSFMSCIALFFLIKNVFYTFIGYIFDMGKLMKAWKNTFAVSFQLLGILYFIPTLLLIYSDSYHYIIIGFMTILFLFIQIILFSRLVLFFIKEKFNFLFLIAYLCTIEILPLIFLSVGLVYLYRIDVLNILWH